MNLTSLSYFVEVAKELNMTKTAHKLHISQQALSFHIQKVEDYYGVPLFERKPLFRLTYAGEICLKNTLSLLKDFEALTNQMAALSGRCMGRLRIGISSHPGKIVLPEIVPEFLQRWPNISLDFHKNTMAERIQSTLNRDLDVCIGIYSHKDPHLSAEFLFDDRLFMVVSDVLLQQYYPDRFHTLKRAAVHGTDLTEFRELPFMMLHASSYLGNVINEYFSKMKIKPNEVLTAKSLDFIEPLVARNVGAMICGRLRMIEVVRHFPNLNAFPLLIDSKNFQHHFKLLTLRDWELPQYARDFMEITKKVFAQLDSSFDVSREKAY